MATALIALGSNLGDRRAHLDAAVAALGDHPRIEVAAVSPFIETDPVGGPPGQPMFLNGACRAETDLAPLDLLDVLKDTERRLGREKNGPPWGPRVIDLDLILYGDEMLATERLTLPHPEFRDRRFVLEPLAHVAPDAVDPVTGRTVRQLLEDLAGR